jgi:hypothetical protein
MVAALVRVFLDHGQGLVVRDALRGREVDACLYKVGPGRVAKRVSHHLIWIEAGRNRHPPKCLANLNGVTGLGFRIGE